MAVAVLVRNLRIDAKHESNMVDKVEALCPLGVSDHISLTVTLAPYTESSINRPSFNYFKDDFVSLRSMIKDGKLTNRAQVCDNINDKWDCFHKTIADGVNLFVQIKRKSSAKNKRQWMTKELKNLVKKKTKSWHTYLGAKSFSNWTFYKKFRNRVTNAVKVAKTTFEHKLVDDMRDNPKAFWKYVRLAKKKKNLAYLRSCKKGIYAKTSESKANILNSFFANIFNEKNMNTIPNPQKLLCTE